MARSIRRTRRINNGFQWQSRFWRTFLDRHPKLAQHKDPLDFLNNVLATCRQGKKVTDQLAAKINHIENTNGGCKHCTQGIGG